jgi:hypothetical protein
MAIDWLDEPRVDDYGTVTLGRWGGWIIQVCPMLYSDRLVLTPERDTMVYDFGWCYPKGGAAHLAALAWDPETEGEPVGFIKAIHTRTREPGQQSNLPPV